MNHHFYFHQKTRNKPPFTVVDIIQLKASRTITKCRRDIGSSSFKPQELLKKPLGVPLIRIEN